MTVLQLYNSNSTLSKQITLTVAIYAGRSRLTLYESHFHFASLTKCSHLRHIFYQQDIPVML